MKPSIRKKKSIDHLLCGKIKIFRGLDVVIVSVTSSWFVGSSALVSHDAPIIHHHHHARLLLPSSFTPTKS
jgi:hypothetical protein